MRFGPNLLGYRISSPSLNQHTILRRKDRQKASAVLLWGIEPKCYIFKSN